MDEILNPVYLLFALLAFCMGARIIKGSFNGRSFSLRVDDDDDAEDDE